MLDALRALATEGTTDARVKQKLLSILAAWQRQFKDDPSMSAPANLYSTVKPHAGGVQRVTRPPPSEEVTHQVDSLNDGYGYGDDRRRFEEREKREKKEEEKRKAKEAKEAEKLRLKKLEADKRKSLRGKTKRAPFSFEQVRGARLYALSMLKSGLLQEKAQVLTSIANATQASNNLVNAITVSLDMHAVGLGLTRTSL